MRTSFSCSTVTLHSASSSTAVDTSWSPSSPATAYEDQFHLLEVVAMVAVGALLTGTAGGFGDANDAVELRALFV